MVNKKKQEVLGARNTEVTPSSQTREGIGCVRVGRRQPTKTHIESRSASYVPDHTLRQKTRQSQTASPPQSPGALGARPPSGAAGRPSPGASPEGLGSP